MRIFKFRRDPLDPAERVDNYQFGRRYRLIAGISIDQDFAVVNGALLAAEGLGRFLKVRVIETSALPIPDSLNRACQQIQSSEHCDANEVARLCADLSNIQAEVFENLRTAAGKLSEQLLLICVTDPGIWGRDFDGKISYTSFCDANQLSELSGVSVMDALPAKDLVAGGQGWPLTPLACWLLVGDRREPEATESRLLLQMDRETELFYLPGSDGLDEHVPAIEYFRSPGSQFFKRILSSFDRRDVESRHLKEMIVSGRRIESLFEKWKSQLANTTVFRPPGQETYVELIDEVLMNSIEQDWSLESIVKTAFELALHSVITIRSNEQANQLPIKRLVLSGPPELNGLTINFLSNFWPELKIESLDAQSGLNLPFCGGNAISAHSLTTVLTATLGLMHVDQMPANIPSLTMADVPRILGRLTPGKPTNWRKLLVEMADYRPPAMRLRDAV